MDNGYLFDSQGTPFCNTNHIRYIFDDNGVPLQQILDSLAYVSDIQRVNDKAQLPTTGSENRLYIDITNGKLYLWSNETQGYIRINVVDKEILENSHIHSNITILNDIKYALNEELKSRYDSAVQSVFIGNVEQIKEGNVVRIPEITGAVSTAIKENMSPNVVIVTNPDGKFTTSNITTTELSALEGMSENINNKTLDISDKIKTHVNNQENPHHVTKEQLGLENVINADINDQKPTWNVSSKLASLISGEKITDTFSKVAKAIDTLISHVQDNHRHIRNIRDDFKNIGGSIHNLTYDMSLESAILSSGVDMFNRYTIVNELSNFPSDFSLVFDRINPPPDGNDHIIDGGPFFDDYIMFKRKRCNLTDDGVVVAYYGDHTEAYTETGALTKSVTKGNITYPIGTNVQVMVEQPKVYYKIIPMPGEMIFIDREGYMLCQARYLLSPYPYDGFKLHPAFISNGEEKDYIYLAAYEGCLYKPGQSSYVLDDAQTADFNKDMLSSIAGAKPLSGATQELTRTNARKLANNRGKGWQLSSIQTIALTQLLFFMEYSHPSMRDKLGHGCTDKSATIDNKNHAELTGGTSSLGNASGVINNGNGINYMSYRGEENFIGNIWTYIDGIIVRETSLPNSNVNCRISNLDYGNENTYKDSGFVFRISNDYFGTFYHSTKCDWAFTPAEHREMNDIHTIGFSFPKTDSIPDSNGNLCIQHGGCWDSGDKANTFTIGVENDTTYHSARTGARLVYIPQD